MESLIIALLVIFVIAVVVTKMPIEPNLKWIAQLLCGVAVVYLVFKLIVGVG